MMFHWTIKFCRIENIQSTLSMLEGALSGPIETKFLMYVNALMICYDHISSIGFNRKNLCLRGRVVVTYKGSLTPTDWTHSQTKYWLWKCILASSSVYNWIKSFLRLWVLPKCDATWKYFSVKLHCSLNANWQGLKINSMASIFNRNTCTQYFVSSMFQYKEW